MLHDNVKDIQNIKIMFFYSIQSYLDYIFNFNTPYTQKGIVSVNKNHCHQFVIII